MLTTKTLTKKLLEIIIQEHFSNFGYICCSHLLESLKFLGFYYATCSGLSISLDDLKTPIEKDLILKEVQKSLEDVSCEWTEGLVTDTERFQQVLSSWSNATEFLKNRIIEYYKKFEPTNSLYIMAFSGARGNIAQVRQLIGMRGLMSDQSGKVISLPIQANFREGLSSIDYIVSSYGARKGIVDTALKTADAGYLTRRLVYVARDIVIKRFDCNTNAGILIDFTDKTNLEHLLGKTLISYTSSLSYTWNFSLKGEIISEKFFNYLLKKREYELNLSNIPFNNGGFFIKIRTPLTCVNFCQQCYGWDLGKQSIVRMGEAVGIIAAQSIGEPGTQLTMRTFHTGGIFTSELLERISTPFAGKLIFPTNIETINFRTLDGKKILKLKRSVNLSMIDWKGENEIINIEKDSFLYVSTSGFFKKNEAIGEFPKDKILFPIKKRKSVYNFLEGEVKFQRKTVFWIFSGKIFEFSQLPFYSYPQFLSEKKSVAKFFFSIPCSGLIKNTLSSYFFFDFNEKIKSNIPNSFETINVIKNYLLNQQNQKILKINNINFEKIYIIQKYLIKNRINNIKNSNFSDKLQLSTYFETRSFKAFYIDSEIKLFLYQLININLQLYPFNNKWQLQNFSRLLLFHLYIGLVFFKKKNFEFNSLKLQFLKNFRSQKKNTWQKSYFFQKDCQYFDEYSLFGSINFFPNLNQNILGYKIKQSQTQKVEFYFLTKDDIWEFFPDQFSESIELEKKLRKNIIHRGKLLTSTLKSLQSGSLLKKDGFRFLFQKILAIFLPSKTDITYKNNDFIQKYSLLANLNTYSQQADDIIQGLPKIERIFENRKKIYPELNNPSFYIGTGIFFPECSFRSFKVDNLSKKLLNTQLNFYQDSKRENFNQNKKIQRFSYICDLRRNKPKILNSIFPPSAFVPTIIGKFFSLSYLNKSKRTEEEFNLYLYKGIDVADLTKFQIPREYRISIKRKLKKDIKIEGADIFSEMSKKARKKAIKRKTKKIIKKKSYKILTKKFFEACISGKITFVGKKIHFFNFENNNYCKKVIKLSLFKGFQEFEDECINNKLKNRFNFPIFEVLDSNKNLVYLVPKENHNISNSKRSFKDIKTSLNNLSINGRKIPSKRRKFLELLYPVGTNLYSFHGIILGAFKLSKKMQLISLNTIQSIYKSQGVKIANIHIELILRKMFRYAILIKSKNGFLKYTQSASTQHLVPFTKHKFNVLEKISKSLEKRGQRSPFYVPAIQSITKAAIYNEGFLSRAGFQESKRMIQQAALFGKSNWIRSLKDAIIVGRPIPSGSNFTLKLRGLDYLFEIKNNDNFLSNNNNITLETEEILSKNKSINISLNEIYSFLRGEITSDNLNALYKNDSLEKFAEKRMQMIDAIEKINQKLTIYSSKSFFKG